MSEFGEPDGKEPAKEPLRFDDELKRYLEADPFNDVEIVTTSGDRYLITDRWQVAFGQNQITVIPGGYGSRIIRKNQIVAIHVHEQKAD
jgi:hypothetical protein